MIIFSLLILTKADTIQDSNGLIYTISDDDSYLIVGTNPPPYQYIDRNALLKDRKYTHIVIPDHVGDRLVRVIGTSSFRLAEIVSVKIANTISSIGDDAFAYCHQLEFVYFNPISELVTMSQGVFYFCEKIKKIFLPPTLQNVSIYVLGKSAYDDVYYCGTKVFTGGIFQGYKSETILPKRVHVRKTYDSNIFGDFEGVLKDDSCLLSFTYRNLRCFSFRNHLLFFVIFSYYKV